MRRAVLALALGLAGCHEGTKMAPPPLGSAIAMPPPPLLTTRTGRPQTRVLLDDPRLVSARQLERSKDWAAAAKAVSDARPSAGADVCAWDYLEGRLELLAGDPVSTTNALAAFDRGSAAACPLADYARLRAAQSAARAGRADDAIARARMVPDAIAARDDTKLVVAESLAAKGDRRAALPLWKSWLAANPYGARWVDTSVRVANALLDGIEGPGHAREAYDMATKVVVEAPKVADASGATAARARAVLGDPTLTDALSETERARQAQALLDTGEAQRAFDLANDLVKHPGRGVCKAAITRANAAAKVKVARVDAWSDAITLCQGDGELVNALYAGAKARSGKDPKLALEWFGKVETLFPAHRLADDARFRAALLVAQSSEQGHEEHAEQMLRSLADVYPTGDMRTEALFRVALAKMQKRDWQAAKPLLDRIVELSPDDHHWATAGRAAYFRARADAETGDVAGAEARYARVVEQHPLAYYMLLAHARLAALDPARANTTVKNAAAKDADAAVGEPQALLASPAIVRAARLLEVGDLEAAKKEIAASGAIADGVDPEVAWSIGALYEEGGAPDIGHGLAARGKTYLAHYPEGKWRLPWQVAFPRAFEPLVRDACGKNGLPAPVAWAIMREESSFVAEAKSPSNAFGLMQLILPTARSVAAGTNLAIDESTLKRPDVSIELGVRLLAKLRTQHAVKPLAFAAYNAGSGAVDRWMNARTTDDMDLFVELVPYEETRNYTKRVTASQAAYAYLYEPTDLAEPLSEPLGFGR